MTQEGDDGVQVHVCRGRLPEAADRGLEPPTADHQLQQAGHAVQGRMVKGSSLP